MSYDVTSPPTHGRGSIIIQYVQNIECEHAVHACV